MHSTITEFFISGIMGPIFLVIPSSADNKANFLKHCRGVGIDFESDHLHVKAGDTSIYGYEYMFIRNAYKELYGLIFGPHSQKDILILGSPGIGKTIFMLYILMRVMHEKKHEIVIYCKLGEDVEYLCAADCNAPILMEEDMRERYLLHHKNTLLLLDAAAELPPIYPFGESRVIFVSSPNDLNYKDFLKSRKPVQLHMPIWTLEEIKSTKKYVSEFADFDDVEISKRFDRFGGIPRIIFANENRFQHYVSSQYSAINNASLDTLLAQFSMVDLGAVSHFIFHHVVTNTQYDELSLKFASRHVQNEVINTVVSKDSVFEDMKWLFYSTRNSTFLNGFRGLMFEPLVFNEFQTRDLALKRAFLSEDVKCNQTDFADCNPEDVHFNKLTVINLDKIEEMKDHQGKDVLLKPTIPNFATVDAIILPDTFLQVTVASKHSVNVSHLYDMMEELSADAFFFLFCCAIRHDKILHFIWW